jgi:hypothetical protein
MPLDPKGDGQGVMLRAFQSGEFGFGFDLSKEEVDEVNFTRRGKEYKDKDAAKKIRGNAEKHPLTTSPFVVEFEFGIANEGYWCYERMVLQMEDCFDVLDTLYPQFDVLLFDHSCGHDKQQSNGLNVENMEKNYAGKQSFLRPTLIKEERGYLGPYEKTLHVGDMQYLTFQPADAGPFYLSEAKREELRKDKVIEGKVTKRKFTKSELVERLRAQGITAGGTQKNLQQLCVRNNIPTEEVIPKIQLGWEGKQNMGARMDRHVENK